MKDYLGFENDRNRRNHRLYEQLLQKALGSDTEVLVVHHITFMRANERPNEIPSADTFMFCPELMGMIFGAHAQAIMVRLAMLPTDKREGYLAEMLAKLEAGELAA